MAAFLKRALEGGGSAMGTSILIASAGTPDVPFVQRDVDPAPVSPASGLAIWCSMVS
jgi:hypothetical protein